MPATYTASLHRRSMVFLFAPLALNILLFIAYLFSGYLVFDSTVIASMRHGREQELMLLRLAGFGVPVVYVLARSRFFRRSPSGHEIALLIFSAWLLGESGDIFSLLQAQTISREVAIFKGVKNAVFAITALFVTGWLVNGLRHRLLGESTAFIDRGRVFILFSIAYFSVTLLILAIHIFRALNETGLLASVLSVAAILAALNLYGYLIFRYFYRNHEAPDEGLRRHPTLVSMANDPVSLRFQSRLAELLQLADAITARHANLAALRSELRSGLIDLRRFHAISNRAANQMLEPGTSPVARIIDKTRKLRFLVADHDATCRKILQEILASEFDCATDLYESGKDALQAALSLDFDLVFLDAALRDVPAFEAARLLRESGKQYGIICVSALGPELIADAQSTGMNAYLEKPYDREEVRLRIEQVLEKE